MEPNVAQLLQEFREAAIAKGDGTGGEADRRLYVRMAAAYHSLVALGPSGSAALSSLALDESVHVRWWAAAALLRDGDPDARAVLDAIVRLGGVTGFNAEMTLREFDARRLGSVFGTGSA